MTNQEMSLIFYTQLYWQYWWKMYIDVDDHQKNFNFTVNMRVSKSEDLLGEE